MKSNSGVEVQRPKEIEIEWLAVYSDNETLKQNYDINGGNHFGHIDKDRLKSFWLVNKSGERILGVDVVEQCFIVDDKKMYVDFPRNRNNESVKGKLVYFRRIKNVFEQTGTIVTFRHCLGLQANVDGSNYQQYIFINEDNTFTLSQKK
jgi:hypothetical protein